MTVAAIVPVGEYDERAFRALGGVPLLAHTVGSLASAPLVDRVVVASVTDRVATVQKLIADHRLAARVATGPPDAGQGSPTPSAVAGLPAAVDAVLVHDPARPLAPAELADVVVRALRAGADAVVPVVPVVDTVKETDPAGRVLGTVDRGRLRAMQTPRGFTREALERAYASADGADADEIDLVARNGGTIVTVPGAEEAFRVTRRLDLVLAEVVLARQREQDG